jgi:hypothetical protein
MENFANTNYNLAAFHERITWMARSCACFALVAALI